MKKSHAKRFGRQGSGARGQVQPLVTPDGDLVMNLCVETSSHQQSFSNGYLTSLSPSHFRFYLAA